MTSKDANEDIAVFFQIDGEVFSPLTIRVSSDARNIVQEAGGSACGFPLKCRV